MADRRKLSEMLAGLDERIGSVLSNNAPRLKKADEAYGNFVKDVVGPSYNEDFTLVNDNAFNRGRQVFADMIGNPLTGASNAQYVDQGMNPDRQRLLANINPYTSATARYVVPGAGLTAAGMELLSMLGNNEDS